MDIKKISEAPNRVKLLITDMDSAFLNSLRRSIMNAVPAFAAETISILENSSIMPDEMLCHRIGLIPIRVNEKKTKKGDSVKLAMEKEGPCVVYSSDIAVPDKSIEVMETKVPLVKLKKDQRIRMEIELKAGTGKEHVKWQPALVSYKPVPKVVFHGVKDPKAFTKNFPASEFEIKAGKLFLADPAHSRIIGLLQDKHPEEVEVDYNTNSFIVTIESFQGQNPREILLEGTQALENKNTEFKEALKEI